MDVEDLCREVPGHLIARPAGPRHTRRSIAGGTRDQCGGIDGVVGRGGVLAARPDIEIGVGGFAQVHRVGHAPRMRRIDIGLLVGPADIAHGRLPDLQPGRVLLGVFGMDEGRVRQGRGLADGLAQAAKLDQRLNLLLL